MTLFDLEPLTPAGIIRHRGHHPVTMLGLDADESRTCGNCARRRFVWIVGRTHMHGDRWETVCVEVSPASPYCDGWGPVDDFEERVAKGWYCDGDCCNAECCAESARDAEADGYDPFPPWPWDGAVEDWMPVCERWRDLEAERVVRTLGGGT